MSTVELPQQGLKNSLVCAGRITSNHSNVFTSITYGVVQRDSRRDICVRMNLVETALWMESVRSQRLARDVDQWSSGYDMVSAELVFKTGKLYG